MTEDTEAIRLDGSVRDYEPVDLSAYCNAGLELYDRDLEGRSGGTWLYPRDRRPPTGFQKFHGLPFQIGPTDPGTKPSFIALGDKEGLRQTPVVVPIGKSVTHAIFAHALLESQLWSGGQLGVVVAHYGFQFSDAEPVDVPIRERFEVGNLPLPWGQYPFLAVADRPASLADRQAGPWEMTGFRQTEASQGTPRGYFLWVWQNPYPAKILQAVELRPGPATLVVAAITLSHLSEWPFVRATRRPIKITLKDGHAAAGPGNIDVQVDRGTATYAYPLPAAPLDQSAANFSGFGAPLNVSNTPAYAQIAATPSATVTLLLDGAALAQTRWGDVEANGLVELPKARIELIDSGKNWVQVTVLDDETGRPVPCRVAFHSPEGVPYPPHGYHAPLFSNMGTWHIDNGGDVRLGQITYAYIDGRCQGWLPRGQVLVDVARGYEYEPLRTWVTITPGQQQLTLKIKRWVDMNAERYFSGDTHVHFLSTQGGHTEAAGEDLNVVNLLLSQWGHLFTNTEDFTGRPSVSPDGRTIVFAGQENRQHILGHLSLLGLRSPVMPWCSDGPDEAELGGGLDITLSEWADRCHAQGGTVVIPHIPTPNCEPAVLVATGRADAVEMLEQLEYEQLEYYRYLNGGYRLPLVGGTDRMDAGVPVGLYRTYVYIPPEEPFTYENWLKGLRSGRTFLSGGPLLWFMVDGQPIGSTLHVSGGGTVEVEARARSIFPIHTLQVIQAGQVVAETTDGQGARELSLKAQLKVNADTWLTARCGGPAFTPIRHFDTRKRGVMAHTSPIYITCGDNYSVFDPATAHYLLTLVEGGRAYIRHVSPQHEPGRVTHHHGDDDHLQHLERPFVEAAQVLQHLLEQHSAASREARPERSQP